MIKLGFEDIYNQLTSLRSLQINGKNIEFIPRAVADGKQRRLDTGKSTAKSSYCIPEAPEHKTQLGDMTIACTSPVEEASLESDYIQFRGTRKESNKIRADFAVTHFGNVGKANITNIPIRDYYCGVTHLVLRSSETISLRISSCFEGL